MPVHRGVCSPARGPVRIPVPELPLGCAAEREAVEGSGHASRDAEGARGTGCATGDTRSGGGPFGAARGPAALRLHAGARPRRIAAALGAGRARLALMVFAERAGAVVARLAALPVGTARATAPAIDPGLVAVLQAIDAARGRWRRLRRLGLLRLLG